MRVLAVIHSTVFGGAHNQILCLHKSLSIQGFETLVLLPAPTGNAHERLTRAGVKVFCLPLHHLRATPNPVAQTQFVMGLWPEIQRVRTLLREERVDIVQAHGPTNPLAAIAGRLEDLPIVWQLLDTRAPMLLRRMCMPVVTRLADVVMSTGRTVAMAHPGTENLGERLVTFTPPVELQHFKWTNADRQAARARLMASPGDFVVGALGNRNPQKGFELLLEACSLAREQEPRLVMRIRGALSPNHNSYNARLLKRASELGFDDWSIESMPTGSEANQILPGFDVLVCSSMPRSEGLPTVILEGMAAGVPVVATDVGGTSEIVEDGVTGFVVPPRDPREIAQAILRLARDSGVRQQMGRAARHRVLNEWPIEACVDSYRRAYQMAIARHQIIRRVGKA
jgi:glycosyltransferase involved in cell wall biosynthesis